MIRRVVFIAVLVIACHNAAIAQFLPVGTPVLEDYYRREQLLGRLDSAISFTVRPAISSLTLATGRSVFYPDSADSKPGGIVRFLNQKGYLQVLPVTIQQRFNSSFPYGWNDGAMIPAKGPQTMVTGGIFIKVGILTIQFKPEFVYAANLPFTGFATDGRSDADLAAYYRFYNYIDMPERLSAGNYSKTFLGQSSIRLNFDPISIGISNENLWWGPGISNSLMMSNNAPGFKHLTLNTTRPINSFLGQFEGQVFAGRLDGTRLPPISVTRQSNGRNLYDAKRSSDWRYFTGFNINYHPKWISGLTLGATRTFQAYRKDVKKIGDYLPYFFQFEKGETIGDPIPRDQRTSVYARWLFKKAHAEVYFEYGLNDNSYNYRDFIGSPDHSRAYIFGARKMIPIDQAKDRYIMVSTELTQMSHTVDRLTRPMLGGWNSHYQIRQGYTHLGQSLGIGGDGNMQTADISWVSGLKKIGVGFERYEHNTDLANRSFAPINGNSRNWVDVSVTLHADWNYRNFLFNALLQPIKSLNYQWITKDLVADSYYIPNNNAYNFYAQLGATYRF